MVLHGRNRSGSKLMEHRNSFIFEMSSRLVWISRVLVVIPHSGYWSEEISVALFPDSFSG
jgi:hypothetical protein